MRGAPKVVRLAVDFHENLTKIPWVAKKTNNGR